MTVWTRVLVHAWWTKLLAARLILSLSVLYCVTLGTCAPSCRIELFGLSTIVIIIFSASGCGMNWLTIQINRALIDRSRQTGTRPVDVHRTLKHLFRPIRTYPPNCYRLNTIKRYTTSMALLYNRLIKTAKFTLTSVPL
jgi:hypothetical protein